MANLQSDHSILHTKNTPPYSSAIAFGFEKAVQEALRFYGATAPNPAVGCSLLDQHGQRLITEGHHKAGTPHAEARALTHARTAHIFDSLHTALVTLEPCNHTGRTPPCTQALIESPVKTVWVGCKDPNPQASGGIERLQQNGIQVIELARHPDPAAQRMARTCQALLAPFAKTTLQKSPWISVKQALNQNGTMTPPVGQNTFTSHSSLKLAHQLRRATDALITGLGTLLADKPLFTIRHVADHEGRKKRLLVICTRRPVEPALTERMQDNGFTVEICTNLEELPTLLYRHSVLWAMVEAGPGLLHALDTHHLWDDWLTIQTHADALDTMHIRTPPWQNTCLSPLSLFTSGAEH